MTTHELIPSVSIAAFLNTREGIRERMKTIHALIAETDAMAAQAGFGWPLQNAINHSGRWERDKSLAMPGGLEVLLHQLDVSGWSSLMDKTGLYTYFDRTARDEWRERINKGDVPPLSVDTIAGVFGTLHRDRRQMMERGVVEVFNRLSWDYKSNQPVKFGMKLVLTNILDYTRSVYIGPNSAVWSLDDLVRALHWIEGTPEPDHRTPTWQSIHGAGTYDFPFFSMTVYKKGTGHLKFKNPTLVDGLNRILANHYPGALPAPK